MPSSDYAPVICLEHVYSVTNCSNVSRNCLCPGINQESRLYINESQVILLYLLWDGELNKSNRKGGKFLHKLQDCFKSSCVQVLNETVYLDNDLAISPELVERYKKLKETEALHPRFKRVPINSKPLIIETAIFTDRFHHILSC